MNKAPNSSSDDPDSLLRRLAGPSTGKAGLAKDQSDMNRIISEASKGSKFYDNEKKKDKDLTERIERILKLRDELTRGADLGKIEQMTDALLKDMEYHRDLSQYIVHVDMDAFYANVELQYDPTLRGKPFGVGRGVLTTASYEARKYGVRSGMPGTHVHHIITFNRYPEQAPGFIAKKLCPELILVGINFSRYSEMSKRVMAVFERYDPTMCPAGCDEGYLNITAYCKENNITPDECVQEMRRKVFEETNLTVSAGIAPNKMLAKICSDKNKPNGQFHLPFERDAVKEFMRDLSIRKIPGIGRVNERLLESIGIKTCGDIYMHRAVVSLMDKQFGLHFLLRTYLGIASNVVQPYTRDERKSIGAERTFNPLEDKRKILQKLEEVSEELEEDMASSGWTGRTVTLKYKLDTYQVFTRAKSCDRWISKKEDLLRIGKDLLLPELPLKLRLIGLRVTKLKDLRTEPTIGIKRFFEATKSDLPEGKRIKMDPAPDQDSKDVGWEEAMPGFHEEEEVDIGNDEVEERADDIPRPRPPASEPARSSQAAIKITVKPRSAAVPKRTAPVQTEQECPICGKTLMTDNQGLNDHIDFCLSRGAILQAQSEASVARSKGKVKNKRTR